LYSVDGSGQMHLNASYADESGNGGGNVDGIVYGGGTGGGGPKPTLWQSVKNFFSNLFGREKAAVATTTATAGTLKVVETGEITFVRYENAIQLEEVVATLGAVARAGQWALPLMLNGDASAPSTKVSDRDITRKPNSKNFYLYRNMIPNGTIPMLGQNRYTLGIRPLDVDGKTGDDFVYPSSLNGLSTTLGIGNSIPSNVPNKTDKTTLFRINAALLPAQGLIPVEIEGNYIRIIPGIRMTAQEFNLRIQLTAPLWTPVR